MILQNRKKSFPQSMTPDDIDVMYDDQDIKMAQFLR